MINKQSEIYGKRPKEDAQEKTTKYTVAIQNALNFYFYFFFVFKVSFCFLVAVSLAVFVFRRLPFAFSVSV